MKRFLIAGLTTILFATGASFAQQKGGYTDDVYYTGSQAEKDAQQQKKSQKKTQRAAYYNSSGNDYYGEHDGNESAYYDGAYDQESYIDYDDDSYTTRMRRFYYPMAGVGYWGSAYSPYWMDPYYGNPYYGMYGPGVSFSFGMGPYWNSYWGMNTWFGYGAFNSWYYPYYGYGYGAYNMGYWNGYYNGYYDGVYRNNYLSYRPVNYGPRGSRAGLRSTGNYSNNARTSPVNRGGLVNPQRGTSQNSAVRTGTLRENNVRPVQRENSTTITTPNRNAQSNIRLNNNNAVGNERQVQSPAITTPQQQPQRQRGIFNQGNRNIQRQRTAPNINTQPAAPSRNQAPVNTRPQQNFNRPAPSRSYSSPAPSRSYSAPSRGSGSGSLRR